jgi:hypothetical protein
MAGQAASSFDADCYAMRFWLPALMSPLRPNTIQNLRSGDSFDGVFSGRESRPIRLPGDNEAMSTFRL